MVRYKSTNGKDNPQGASSRLGRDLLHGYRAWDGPTRWFHWINALLVLTLIILGVALLAGPSFGVGQVGRDRLIRIHELLGLTALLNLMIRFYWAFCGNRYARWRAILPGGRGYGKKLQAYLSAFSAGEPKYYIGHNPLARIGVAALLLLLLLQIFSGLAILGLDQLTTPAVEPFSDRVMHPRIGTDALYPVLPWMFGWAPTGTAAARAVLQASHLYGFYGLIGLVVLHVAAVIATEIREGGDIVSSMLTGWKSLPGEPEDSQPTRGQRLRPKRRRSPH